MSDDWTDPGMTSRGWFKPAVGLWFALLLGGGLFLMPASVHASIAQATGIAGKMLISAIAGGIGLLLGLAIAGRVAKATAPRAIAPGLEPHDDGWPDEDGAIEEEPKRRRVFSAREDIGEEGIGMPEMAEAESEFHEADPARAFEDILAEIPHAAEPDEGWETQEPVIEIGAEESGSDEDPLPPQVEIEEAEFETIEEEVEREPEPAPHEAAPAALGDLTLQQLEDRLAAALASRKKAPPAPSASPEDFATEMPEPGDTAESQLDDPDDDDPVIAFLRREASRKMPQKEPSPPQRDYDAQAALRQALDKLGKVGKPGD